MPELTVRLHKPHAKQVAFMRSPAKRKVIVAGRRGGKTTGCADIAVKGLLAGHRVLEAAPVADQTTAFWDTCKQILAEPIAAGVVYKNETERLLRLPESAGGGRIRTKTAFNADTLRGDYADLLILDEYAMMEPSAWDEVGAPMLLDNDGDAVFISTPMRKNHFHSLYVRALGDDTGRWAAFQFTSHDNPYLSREALAEITADMTEDAYRQEILAEFLDNDGAVFRNIGACLHAPLDVEPKAHKGHHVVLGADWGKKGDYTAFSVVCADCRAELARHRRNMLDYHVQRQDLVTLCERWGVDQIVPEANAMGEPIIEELRRDPALRGVAIEPFDTTSTSKPPLIESLRLCFERVEGQWQADPIWTGELEAYEVKYSGQAGRPVYSAPEGVHDDTVMARALAWWAVARPSRVTYMPSIYG